MATFERHRSGDTAAKRGLNGGPVDQGMHIDANDRSCTLPRRPWYSVRRSPGSTASPQTRNSRASPDAPRSPVSSGRTDRHRLDPGGNRQLNHAFHMLALTRYSAIPDRRLHRQATQQRQDQPRSDPQPQTAPRSPRLPPPARPQQYPQDHLLDIGAIGDPQGSPVGSPTGLISGQAAVCRRAQRSAAVDAAAVPIGG